MTFEARLCGSFHLHCRGKSTTGAAACGSGMQSSPCSNLGWPASHRLPHAGLYLGSKHHLGSVAHLENADRPQLRDRLPCPMCASTKLAAATHKLRPGNKQQKRLTGTQKISLKQSSSLEPRDVPLADRFFSAVTGYPFPLGPFFEVGRCTLTIDWRPMSMCAPPALPSFLSCWPAAMPLQVILHAAETHHPQGGGCL